MLLLHLVFILLRLTPSHDSDLVMTVTPSDTHVLEKAPTVMRIRLENQGSSPTFVHFKDGRSLASKGNFKILAVDENGARYEVSPLKPSLIANSARAAGNPFNPGQSIETDVVMCLALDGGTSESFLRPGKYTMKGLLSCPTEVYSNDFEITVVSVTGADAEALAALPAVSFYAQGIERIPRVSAKWARGGNPDEIRTAINHIEADIPDSKFALWLHYWRAFHGLESDDPDEKQRAIEWGLKFASDNPRFPLTDNLLHRIAMRLKRSGNRTQATAIMQRIRNEHPDTDIPDEEFEDFER